MSWFGLVLKDFVACLETRFDGINDERNLEDVRCDILEKFSLTCVLLPCGILDGVSNSVFSFGKVIFRLVLVKVREGFTFLGALLGLKACMPISASSNMQSRNLTLNTNKYKLKALRLSLMQRLSICWPCKVRCSR